VKRIEKGRAKCSFPRKKTGEKKQKVEKGAPGFRHHDSVDKGEAGLEMGPGKKINEGRTRKKYEGNASTLSRKKEAKTRKNKGGPKRGGKPAMSDAKVKKKIRNLGFGHRGGRLFANRKKIRKKCWGPLGEGSKRKSPKKQGVEGILAKGKTQYEKRGLHWGVGPEG